MQLLTTASLCSVRKASLGLWQTARDARSFINRRSVSGNLFGASDSNERDAAVRAAEDN